VSDRRSALLATAVLVATGVLAGCGGGSDHAPRPGSGPATSPPPPPLKVVAVSPRHLTGTSAITVRYSTPLTSTSPLPELRPSLPGSWVRQGATAVFTPTQSYPPDVAIKVRAAKRAGAKPKQIASRTTPHGSLLRAEQILARLHYLPLKTTAAPLPTPADEAAAVYQPPKGHFSWRFPNIPSTLKHDWTPGSSGQVLRGAVIAFQHHEGLTADAFVGHDTWEALIKADLANDKDPDRYSFVSADLNLPQRLSVWVEGHTVLTSPVNGGVAGAPTPLGTYPVYDRYASTTMSGTNPDGSHYSDPGVPWVNYFSGGSAVHGFPRASYGTPQSVGCLELPISTAKRVYGLISYGTLVTVTGPRSVPTSASPSPPPGATPPRHQQRHHHH
jgi:peptidoglycan hydrolase-like protein with peptidoglycan-binding domain